MGCEKFGLEIGVLFKIEDSIFIVIVFVIFDNFFFKG